MILPNDFPSLIFRRIEDEDEEAVVLYNRMAKLEGDGDVIGGGREFIIENR
jgi:hypothetical protein